MRVHELAKILKIDNREVVRIGKELGIQVANSMTNLEDDDVNKIKSHLSNTEKKEKNKRIEKENKPRVDVQKIEERLAKQEKEKLKAKKEAEEKARKEAEEKSKTEAAKAEKQAKSPEKKEVPSTQKSKSTTKEEKPSTSKDTTKKERKPFKGKTKESVETVEVIEVQPERSNRKKSRNKDKKEDKMFSDSNVSRSKSFTRDLTKKTGNTVSKQKKAAKKDDKTKSDDNKVYSIQFPITVKGFSEAVDMTSAEIITKLMGLGIMANINQNLDEDTVEILSMELGIEIETPEPEEEVSIDELFGLDSEDDEKNLITRAPVVTVMGHVDHGKTSLLDKIKSTKVTVGEAGGITQHIGAYTVRVNENKITFLDTPGHEAFTMMRMRGAQVTDIAILVVAADDGVMPQTIEAIAHSKSAEVPIIVAINKIDKPTANIDRVKQELIDHGLVSEDWGGDTIMVPVSAHTGEGIDELLEMILLVAEVQELKANPDRLAVASVIEAKLDTGRGPVATVLVQKGTLRVGDNVASGLSSGRIRSMTDDKGKSVKKAGPSMPVEIQGLSEVPNAGDQLFAFEDEKTARAYAEKVNERLRAEQLSTSKVSLNDLFARIKEGELKDLNLIIKGDVKGSVEALSQSIMKLSSEEVKINIIHTGVGGIAESDISLASTSNAIIIGFNVRPNNNSLEIAKEENVDIRTYTVIYKAIEDIEAAVKGMHAPKFVENFIGRAEVRDTFKLPNGTIIAGSYVISGKITRDSNIKILRDDIIIHEGVVSSLRRFKDDVKEVNNGYECGIGIDDFNDLQVGDLFEASVMEEVK